MSEREARRRVRRHGMDSSKTGWSGGGNAPDGGPSRMTVDLFRISLCLVEDVELVLVSEEHLGGNR